jgi:hypothetical protein
MRPQLAYLHGFASGPGSTKAQFLRARLAELGVALTIPELAPDFRRMTIGDELAVVEHLLAAAPAVLIGSSLGGYLAALAAERHPERVVGLVLLAPAFGFAERWQQRLGEQGVSRWRADGELRVFHYGAGREESLSIGFLDDAKLHPAQPDAPCPALVVAGRHDDTVPLEAVERFARARAGRELVVLDTGHEMTDALDPLWQLIHDFLAALGILPPASS